MSKQVEEKQEEAVMEDLSVTAKYLKDMISRTMDMEVARGESLRKMSGTLLTGSSIILVALLTVAAPTFDFLDDFSALKVGLLTTYSLTLAALFVFILLAVISQLRFGYQALPSPKDFRDKIDDGLPFDQISAARQMAKPMEEVWQSLIRRNNIMRGLLTASAICVFVATGVIFMAGCLLLPNAFEMLGCRI